MIDHMQKKPANLGQILGARTAARCSRARDLPHEEEAEQRRRRHPVAHVCLAHGAGLPPAVRHSALLHCGRWQAQLRRVRDRGVLSGVAGVIGDTDDGPRDAVLSVAPALSPVSRSSLRNVRQVWGSGSVPLLPWKKDLQLKVHRYLGTYRVAALVLVSFCRSFGLCLHIRMVH